MKILTLNGSPHQHECVDFALTEAEKIFSEHGVETERFWIGTRAVHGCIDCKFCRTHHQCVFGEDLVNSIIEGMQTADGLLIGSPVYYAGPNGTLQAILDRAFHALDKSRCTLKAGAALVSCRRGGASATFDRLNKYFTIYEIPVAASCYWNSIHGNTVEEVKKDLEGLKTVHVLAQNMYDLISARLK